jgi:hypothetical protein
MHQILPHHVQLQNPHFDIWLDEVHLQHSVCTEFSFAYFGVLNFDEVGCDDSDLFLPKLRYKLYSALHTITMTHVSPLQKDDVLHCLPQLTVDLVF